MGYRAVFYSNTGINGVNSYDTPEHFESACSPVYITSDLDILQCEGLSQFIVAGDYNLLRTCDMVKLYNSYETRYFRIPSPVMRSDTGTIIVPVSIDPLLSAGGINSIQFTDGMTVRHHVPKIEDTFGAFCEDDPLLVPSKPLEIDEGEIMFNYKTNTNPVHLVESTLNLGAMGEDTATGALTYTDPNTGKDVTVPNVLPLSSLTRTAVQISIPGGSTVGTITPNTCYFNPDKQKTAKGIAKARGLGAETSVLNSWLIPSGFISEAREPSDDGRINFLISNTESQTSSLPYIYATAQNMRVLYGHLNRYCIQSVASGNSAEYDPEDIINGSETAPTISVFVDPRPSGKPYFRSQYFKGNSDFFINCVPGLEWQDAPLVYYSKSGKEKDAFNFATVRQYQKNVYNEGVKYNQASEGTRQYLSQQSHDFSAVNSLMSIGGNAFGENGSTAGVAAGGLGLGMGLLMSDMKEAAARTMYDASITRDYALYNLSRAKEQAQFNLEQSIVEPTIQYPRSESLRDFLGNGCRVYRYRLSASDVQKCDKILTMYGYKDAKPIELTDFTNRAKFNYVQANGVQVTGDNIPYWLKELISAQLASGVRLWHTRIDLAAYTDGTNI